MTKINILAHFLLIVWFSLIPKGLVSYLIDRKRTNFVLFWWACLIISVLLFSYSFLTKFL